MELRLHMVNVISIPRDTRGAVNRQDTTDTTPLSKQTDGSLGGKKLVETHTPQRPDPTVVPPEDRSARATQQAWKNTGRAHGSIQLKLHKLTNPPPGVQGRGVAEEAQVLSAVAALQARVEQGMTAVTGATSGVPDLATLAASKTKPLELALLAHFVDGGPAQGFGLLPAEKQGWIDSEIQRLNTTLGLGIPPLVAVYEPDFERTRSGYPTHAARCIDQHSPNGDSFYALVFGPDEHAFMRERLAHEISHAALETYLRGNSSPVRAYLELRTYTLALTRAHDADSSLRPAMMAAEAALQAAGIPYHQLMDSFILTAHHELFADLVACLDAGEPDAIFNAERISQGGTITQGFEEWNSRRFSVDGPSLDGSKATGHTAMSAARGAMWRAAQAAREYLTLADVVQVAKETIANSIAESLAQGIDPQKFREDLAGHNERLALMFAQALENRCPA